jgi:nucleotide-binding universal stress UspA family protein
MYRKILTGFDGSSGAKMALKEAAGLGKIIGAKVTALWVQSTLPHYPETVGEIDEEKHAANVFFGRLKREVETISKEIEYPIICSHRAGHPSSTLLEFSEAEKFDLIVLGHSGHSPFRARVLGHTADRISEHAHCNVLIVRKSIAANSKRKPSRT